MLVYSCLLGGLSLEPHTSKWVKYVCIVWPPHTADWPSTGLVARSYSWSAEQGNIDVLVSVRA